MAEILKDLPEYKFFQPTSDIGIYKEILNRSIFTLSPRGFGYTSFRMFEAILSGSIPIYVWEDKCALPFEDVLDWSQFAIVININEITNLPNILKGVDIKKMQDKVQSVKKFFNYEYIAEYIAEYIKERIQ
jgi:hypothetical protein